MSLSQYQWLKVAGHCIDKVLHLLSIFEQLQSSVSKIRIDDCNRAKMEPSGGCLFLVRSSVQPILPNMEEQGGCEVYQLSLVKVVQCR